MRGKHPVKEGRTVEEADFEEAVKRHMVLVTNEEVIKALLFQKARTGELF